MTYECFEATINHNNYIDGKCSVHIETENLTELTNLVKYIEAYWGDPVDES